MTLPPPGSRTLTLGGSVSDSTTSKVSMPSSASRFLIASLTLSPIGPPSTRVRTSRRKATGGGSPSGYITERHGTVVFCAYLRCLALLMAVCSVGHEPCGDLVDATSGDELGRGMWSTCPG